MKRARPWLGSLVLAGLPIVAGAQNLLPNPDFDGDLSGWDVQGGAAYLAAGWPTGVLTPGSVQGVTASAGPNVNACVAVTPSSSYLLSYYAFIPTGQTATGDVYAILNRYSDSGCVTNLGAIGIPGVGTPSTSWQPWNATLSTDATTHSLRVWFTVAKSGGTGSFEGRVDGVFFGQPVKGDFNRDGRVDLVLDDLATNTHQVWFMAKERQAQAANISPDADGPDWKLSAVDDFDTSAAGRDKDDVAFRNTATGDLQFWLMNGVNRTSVAALSGAAAPPVEWQLTAAADFDHDGHADLLWRNGSTQKLMVWTMNGTAFKGTLTPSPDQAVDGNWSCVAALDVNKDGNPDLLWYNATTGKIVVWYMNASVVRLTGKFAEPPNAGDNNWKVLAAGDYARVASPSLDSVDLVWRNETSGKLVIWYMDSFFIKVGGGFTAPTNPTPALGWSVAGPR